MKQIGKLLPKKANEIINSKIGIGFECLDRKMWEDVDSVYEAAAESGAKHARVQTGWGRTETAPGCYDFAWLDRIVDNLQKGGIQPWFNLGYGHVFYTDAKEPDACGWVPLYSEKARAGWTAYITALVYHFRNRITHYEVWNEPDNRNFWRPGPPDPKEYVELVALTAKAIKAVQPNAQIIAGQCGLNLWDAPKISAYLDYGLGNFIDIFTFHRYRVMPEIETPEWVAFFRDLFKRQGYHSIELWQGESGFPSKISETEALAGVPVNETVQAKLLARSILTDLCNKTDYTCYFTISDFKYYWNNGFRNKPNFFGLLTTDNPPRRKPAYETFRNLCSLFDAETVLDETSLAAMETCDALAEQDRYLFHEMQTSSKIAVFQRREFPLIVWWRKVSGLYDHKPYPMNLIVWSKDKTFHSPVLIDLLDGNVFLPEYEFEKPDFRIKGRNLPLKDYPMILTDLQAIEDCYVSF